MTVQEFRKKVKPYAKLSIAGKDFLIKEVVKFRFDPVRNSPPTGPSGAPSAGMVSNGVDDGSFYIKCFLSDNHVFADDLNENMFLLVKEVKTLFVQPFNEELDFDTKKFKFLYSAHAVAEKIYGEEIFKKGEGEKFWAS